MRSMILACVLLLPACAGAGGSPAPADSGPAYGKFDGSRVERADPNAFPLIVVSVDGRDMLGMSTEVRLAPGFHYLHVASAKPGARGELSFQPMAIEVAPCTNYYFHAFHDAKQLSNRQWRIVEDGTRVRADCDPAAATK